MIVVRARAGLPFYKEWVNDVHDGHAKQETFSAALLFQTRSTFAVSISSCDAKANGGESLAAYEKHEVDEGCECHEGEENHEGHEGEAGSEATQQGHEGEAGSEGGFKTRQTGLHLQGVSE